ncbi:sigma-54-dependent Fis family transcriptional regulator [bacterium]|nr:sigma-54-dependent Fis family transcriptional regulator [bacterium]
MSQEKILIVEDNEDLAFTLTRVLQKEGYEIFCAGDGEEAIKVFKSEIIDLVLLDLKLPKISGMEVLTNLKEYDPDCIALMMTGSTDPKPAIEAMKNGAYDYLMKPFELDELKLVVKKALETHELKREVARLTIKKKSKNPCDEIFGNSKGIEDIKNLIKVVAATPKTSVLIQGDSGTGKELVANALHYSSARANEPFIKLNCAAIPDNLLESELFGFEKGAFTDAKTMKKGLFELANDGTIFLDEISSLKLTLQPKILRVIESQTFRRIGGTSDIKINIRVVAATNVDLGEQVKAKEFRDDLYYRLKVMEIKLPPLKERKEDILLLAKLFIQGFNKEFNRQIKKIDSTTEELLISYNWPGNIRELKNVIERCVILSQDDVLQAEHLPIEFQEQIEEDVPSSASFGLISLIEMEKLHILDILNRVSGNKSQAARVLNISRSTLREKLKSYGMM